MARPGLAACAVHSTCASQCRYGCGARRVGSRVKTAGPFCHCAQTNLRTDEFVRREPARSLHALGAAAGQRKSLQVLVGRVGDPVMAALAGGFFKRAVQVLDLAVGPRASGLGRAVLRTLFAADAVKAVPARQEWVRLERALHPVVRRGAGAALRNLPLGGVRKSSPENTPSLLGTIRLVYPKAIDCRGPARCTFLVPWRLSRRDTSRLVVEQYLAA